MTNPGTGGVYLLGSLMFVELKGCDWLAVNKAWNTLFCVQGFPTERVRLTLLDNVLIITPQLHVRVGRCKGQISLTCRLSVGSVVTLSLPVHISL